MKFLDLTLNELINMCCGKACEDCPVDSIDLDSKAQTSVCKSIIRLVHEFDLREIEVNVRRDDKECY